MHKIKFLNLELLKQVKHKKFHTGNRDAIQAHNLCKYIQNIYIALLTEQRLRTEAALNMKNSIMTLQNKNSLILETKLSIE